MEMKIHIKNLEEYQKVLQQNLVLCLQIQKKLKKEQKKVNQVNNNDKEENNFIKILF